MNNQLYIQHGRYLENWYLEVGRHLEASEADTEVGVLNLVDSGFRGRRFLIDWGIFSRNLLEN